MDRFVELFERYGYKVEPFGDSYIADNGKFCIPFTIVGTEENPLITGAVVFSSCDKENIKKQYEGENQIGYRVLYDLMDGTLKFTQIGGVQSRPEYILSGIMVELLKSEF